MYKSFEHAIVFAFHPTNRNSDRSKLSNNNRFNQHDLSLPKYLALSNDISELEYKLNLRINLFLFDDAFGYKRYALFILDAFTTKKLIYYFGARDLCDKILFTTLF